MKKDLLKKLGKSVLRILTALLIVLGIPALAYWLWQPGKADFKFHCDHWNNAIWLGHGWLGDDSWFLRNKRNKDNFRSAGKISALFKKLSENKISTVYPHLCPAQKNGNIAPYDNAQMELFLDLAGQYKIKVIPWVGGVLDDSARIANKSWRQNFVSSIDDMLKKHPRLAGVQVNVEPLPSGNADFLSLLDDLRQITKGKTLSVAAYPPPTKWHQYPNVHWESDYINLVASRCDQMAVMMYDTAIPLEKFYIKLMSDWTKTIADATYSTNCEVLLGIPAYDDAGVGYHHPQVENISSALQGIAAQDLRKWVRGIAIYCEWEMDKAKWQTWQNFMR